LHDQTTGLLPRLGRLNHARGPQSRPTDDLPATTQLARLLPRRRVQLPTHGPPAEHRERKRPLLLLGTVSTLPDPPPPSQVKAGSGYGLLLEFAARCGAARSGGK